MQQASESALTVHCLTATLPVFAYSSVVQEGVPPVQLMYLVFTRRPGESYHRRLRSFLLGLCDVLRALLNSPVY